KSVQDDQECPFHGGGAGKITTRIIVRKRTDDFLTVRLGKISGWRFRGRVLERSGLVQQVLAHGTISNRANGICLPVFSQIPNWSGWLYMRSRAASISARVFDSRSTITASSSCCMV